MFHVVEYMFHDMKYIFHVVITTFLTYKDNFFSLCMQVFLLV